MKVRFIENENQEIISDSIVLLPNNSWNDYGYIDSFNVKYVPLEMNKAPINIGMYRIICNHNIYYPYNTYLNISNSTQESNINLSNNFLSLGLDSEFYIKLFKTLIENNHQPDEIKELLNRLNDILLIPSDNLELERKRTLKQTSITFLTSNMEFNDVDKTLFRDDNGVMYSFNLILEKYNHSLFDFLYSEAIFNLLQDFNTNGKLLDEVINFITPSTNSAVKPLIETIISSICNDSHLAEKSTKFLTKIRIKYELDTDLTSKIDKILESFPKITRLVDDIKKDLEVDEQEINKTTIGHYTSLSTLPYLIKNNEEKVDDNKRPYMRLTNINQMNDPFEGKILLKFLKLSSTYSTQNYVSCATTACDQLPMWNLYGDNATGIFLIYNKEYLTKIINDHSTDSPTLYHVCYFRYDENNKKIEDICVPSATDSKKIDTDSIKDKLVSLRSEIKHEAEKTNDNEERKEKLQQIEQIIKDISFLFKGMEYSYEEEIRFCINSPIEIKLQSNGSAPFPFLYTYFKKEELQYDRIILGPRSSIEPDYIAPYINYASNNKTKVGPSQAHIR